MATDLSMLPADGAAGAVWPGGYRTAITNAANTADAAATAAANAASAAAALAVVTPKTVSTTTYTLLVTDQNLALIFTNVAGCTVTIPAASVTTFPVGWSVELRQANTGAITVGVGAGNLTPITRMGTLVSAGKGAILGLANYGTDQWWLSGPTTA